MGRGRSEQGGPPTPFPTFYYSHILYLTALHVQPSHLLQAESQIYFSHLPPCPQTSSSTAVPSELPSAAGPHTLPLPALSCLGCLEVLSSPHSHNQEIL